MFLTLDAVLELYESKEENMLEQFMRIEKKHTAFDEETILVKPEQEEPADSTPNR
ncbi:hypothetical protein [Paenibacillus thermotolerans]|uniref:hypothetical protein n=1 Tax=Paenibacillus thermotolerans TaxID=3027807 RepID=UPI002367AA3B|nr:MULTISPECIES: hypothetical protein [unclassified Paenibacillus]